MIEGFADPKDEPLNLPSREGSAGSEAAGAQIKDPEERVLEMIKKIEQDDDLSVEEASGGRAQEREEKKLMRIEAEEEFKKKNARGVTVLNKVGMKEAELKQYLESQEETELEKMQAMLKKKQAGEQASALVEVGRKKIPKVTLGFTAPKCSAVTQALGAAKKMPNAKPIVSPQQQAILDRAIAMTRRSPAEIQKSLAWKAHAMQAQQASEVDRYQAWFRARKQAEALRSTSQGTRSSRRKSVSQRKVFKFMDDIQLAHARSSLECRLRAIERDQFASAYQNLSPGSVCECTMGGPTSGSSPELVELRGETADKKSWHVVSVRGFGDLGNKGSGKEQMAATSDLRRCRHPNLVACHKANLGALDRLSNGVLQLERRAFLNEFLPDAMLDPVRRAAEQTDVASATGSKFADWYSSVFSGVRGEESAGKVWGRLGSTFVLGAEDIMREIGHIAESRLVLR